MFEVAVGSLEIGFVIGDLFFQVGAFCAELLAPVLDFAYRKGVLFKLLFDRRTPLVCCF
jgi:hypothetical protein